MEGSLGKKKSIKLENKLLNVNNTFNNNYTHTLYTKRKKYENRILKLINYYEKNVLNSYLKIQTCWDLNFSLLE